MYELCNLIKNEFTESTNEAESINNSVSTLPNLNTDIVCINYEEKIEEPTDSDELHADDNHNSDDKPTDVDFLTEIQDNMNAASQLEDSIHENHLSKFDKYKVIDRSFKCHICTASFTQASNLRRHIQSRHVGEKKFNCDLCLKSFTTKVSLNYHLKSHTGENPFKCTQCNYSCKMNCILNKHYRRKHSISNHVTSKFNCLICGKNFLAQFDFKQHMVVHEKPFKCTTCGVSFSLKSNLKRHMFTHTGEKPFDCHLCHKRFKVKESLKRHLKSHETESFKCTVCEYMCVTQYQLTMHKWREHNTFEGEQSNCCCFICDEKFPHEDYLRSHMLDHEKIKCHICGVMFSEKSELEAHNMTTHTGEKPFECTQTQNHEKIKCHICGVMFSEKSELEAHNMTTHTGEKSFECTQTQNHEKIKCHICGVMFSEKSDLEAHMTIHTGQKAFECRMCNKHYPLNYKLKHYLEFHMEKKPFQCHLCNKRFESKNSLRGHLKIHMRKQPLECTQIKDTGITEQQDENQTKAKSKLFECRTCGQTFINQHDLNCHMLNYGHTLKCSVCETIFVLETNLKQHMKTHIRENRLNKSDFDATRLETLRMQPIHNDNLEQNSSSCEFITTVSDVLNFDNESNSSRLSVTTLDSIDVTSQVQDENSKSEYKIKLAESEENSFKCTICNAVFSLKKKLEDHIVTTHDFKCTLCLKQYVQEKDFQDHVKSHGVHKSIKYEQNIPEHPDTILITAENAVVNKNSNKSSTTYLTSTELPDHESEFPETPLSISRNLEAIEIQLNCGEAAKDFTKTNEIRNCDNESYSSPFLAEMPDVIDVTSDMEDNSSENRLPKCYVQLVRLPENITCTEVVKIGDLNQMDTMNTSCKLSDDTNNSNNKPFDLDIYTSTFTHESLKCHLKSQKGENLDDCITTQCNSEDFKSSVDLKQYVEEKDFQDHLKCHGVDKLAKCEENVPEQSATVFVKTEGSDIDESSSNSSAIYLNNMHLPGNEFEIPETFLPTSTNMEDMKMHLRCNGEVEKNFTKTDEIPSCDNESYISTFLAEISDIIDVPSQMESNSGENWLPKKCHLCHKLYKSKSSLDYHMKIHTGQKPFKCTECNYACRKNSWLNMHYWNKHNIVKAKTGNNYCCSICGKNFPFEFYLKRHMLTHLKPFKCNICGVSFSIESNLKCHMITHTGEKPYECDLCDKHFTTELPDHESEFPETPLSISRNLEAIEIQLNCGEAAKDFTKTSEIRNCDNESYSSPFLAEMPDIIDVTSDMEGNSSLPENITSTKQVKVIELNHLDDVNTSHRLSDEANVHGGETNLKCRLCHKYYKADASLAHSTGKKPFKCTECNDACKKNLALINDYWSKYNISKAETSNYCCSICGKDFPYGYYLKRHILTHLKLFKCSLCGMSISSERSLERHMMTHTSEKRYECHICHKCYTTKELLNYHLKSHTGEKPFKCSQCKYACKTQKSLNSHFKIHNKNHSIAESKSFKSFKSHSVDNPAKCEENILEQPVTVFIKSEKAEVDKSSNNSSTIYLNTLQLPENESEISKTFIPISTNMEAMNVQLNYDVEVKEDFTKTDDMYSCDNESNNLQFPVKISDSIDITSQLESNNSEYGLPKCYVQLIRLPENITSTEVVKVSELNHLDSINTLHKTMLTNKLSNKHMIIDGNDNPKCYVCHLCHKGYTLKSYLDCHLKTHTGQKPFKCTECNYACSINWNLNRHYWSKHNISKAKATTYSCSICGKNFPYEFFFKSHMLIHLKPFKCNTCGKSFSYEPNLRRHMITHTDEKPYECYLCHKRFTAKESLKYHIKSHTGEKPFKCTECNYACNKNYFLNMHCLNKHNISTAKATNYNCSICGKNFPYERYLKRHMLYHSKPFKCSTCGMSFSLESNLKRHVNTHTGEKPYECHLCLKRFTVKESLKYHLTCHTGQKPFKCTECNYAGKKTVLLNMHYWTKHNISRTKATNCSCSICDKNFPSEFYLKKHMISHLKPFKCNICGMGLYSKSNLKRHMITHTGEKPFECNLCHKCFTNKTSLEYHLKSHMGEKPFKCTQCTYACKTQKELKRHSKRHDKNQSKAKSKPSEKSNLEDRILDNKKSFKCSVCLEQYTQEKDLQDHFKSHNVDELMERKENVSEYATFFIKSSEECCTEPLELKEDIKVEYPYLNDEFENSDNTEDVKYFNLKTSSIIKDPLP